MILKGAAEFLQIHALAVALHVAEPPGCDGERLLEVVALLEFLDKSIENLARLGSGHANEGGDEFAFGDGEIDAVKLSDACRLTEISIIVLSIINANGYNFVEMKDVLNGEGLVFPLRGRRMRRRAATIFGSLRLVKVESARRRGIILVGANAA